MFTEEHINCSIDKLELSAHRVHALNISLSLLWVHLYIRDSNVSRHMIALDLKYKF